MSAQPDYSNIMTEAEYLAFERESESKHEFADGEIYAMAGASEAHNLICTNTILALGSHLRKRGCRIYHADMRVRTAKSRRYTYPDIAIVCGDVELTDDKFDTLLNPTIIIEVLSPSTEASDRGGKFQAYREIPSLREYLLISQSSAHVEQYVFQEDGIWRFSDAQGLDATITLPSIDCTLQLADVYAQIEIEEDDQV